MLHSRKEKCHPQKFPGNPFPTKTWEFLLLSTCSHSLSIFFPLLSRVKFPDRAVCGQSPEPGTHCRQRSRLLWGCCVVMRLCACSADHDFHSPDECSLQERQSQRAGWLRVFCVIPGVIRAGLLSPSGMDDQTSR